MMNSEGISEPIKEMEGGIEQPSVVAVAPVKTRKQKKRDIYMLQVITRKAIIPFTSVGANIKEILQKKLSRDLEGKCTTEGFIKTNSVRVMSYSSGMLQSKSVVFDVLIECLICNPVEGMKFKVNVINSTKAGLRCEAGKDSPVDVFIARDHHYSVKAFSSIKVGDDISVRVIGQRYELNDPRISVIAEYVRAKKQIPARKPRLVLQE